MAATGAEPYHVALRQALARLAASHHLLSKAAREETQTAGIDTGAEGQHIRIEVALGRLHALRRSLDAILELGEANGEDACIEVALQQHDRALIAREDADEHCRREEQEIADLKLHVAELENQTAKGKRGHLRLQEVSGEERLRALEQQRSAAEALLHDLKNSAGGVTSTLFSSSQRNRELDLKAKIVTEEHRISATMNLQAREALAISNDPNLESYKRTKDQERSEADVLLAQARRENEADVKLIQHRFAELQARYASDLEDMRGEVQSLQALLAKKRAQAEEHLARQSSDHRQALEEADANIAADLKQLEELRRQKVLAVRSAVANARQQMIEVSMGAQRQLEVHMNEAKLAYRNRVLAEEARCDELIIAERRAVEEAKQQRWELEKRAYRTRESCRRHANQSGSYVKSLDPQRKQQLAEIWQSGA